jgi:hypothetical protein
VTPVVRRNAPLLKNSSHSEKYGQGSSNLFTEAAFSLHGVNVIESPTGGQCDFRWFCFICWQSNAADHAFDWISDIAQVNIV